MSAWHYTLQGAGRGIDQGIGRSLRIEAPEKVQTVRSCGMGPGGVHKEEL